MYACLHAFFFPSHPFWGSGSGLQPLPCVAGSLGCAGSSLWIFLAMAGIFAVLRSQHPSACARLFAFLPPLVEVELEHECGSLSFFVSGLPP
jgi:hypothetical protein